MSTPADSLAALRDGMRYVTTKAERPELLKLDTGVSLELPGTRTLARTYVIPRMRETFDVYKLGDTLLTRPTGTDATPTAANQLDLAADLGAALAALPDRPDAGRPYRDLCLFVREALPDTRADYLRRTIAQARRLASSWRPAPSTRVQRGAPLTVAERKAAQRTRERDAETASALWWLESLLDEPEDDLGTGTRITAAALYELAADTLGELAADEERLDDEDDASPIACVPGPRVFYAIADEVLGTRRRGAQGAHTYVLPPPFNIHRMRSLLRRKQYARALTLQRERPVADAHKRLP